MALGFEGLMQINGMRKLLVNSSSMGINKAQQVPQFIMPSNINAIQVNTQEEKKENINIPDHINDNNASNRENNNINNNNNNPLLSPIISINIPNDNNIISSPSHSLSLTPLRIPSLSSIPLSSNSRGPIATPAIIIRRTH